MRRSSWLGLTLIVAIALFLRSHTYSEPPDRDITAYAVIAHEMLTGRELYTDLWDHKPPAVHVTYALAEIVAGYGPAAIFILSVAATLVSALGIFFSIRLVTQRSALAIVGAATWVLIANDMQLQGNAPNTEAFINAALTCSVALLIGLPSARRRTRALVLIGLLFALASLYKHVAIVPAALLASAHLFVPDPNRTVSFTRRLRDASAWAASGALSWALIAGYFALLGRFDDFHAAVFTFNRAYAGDMSDNLSRGFLTAAFYPEYLRFTLPLLALSLLGAVLGLRRRAREWTIMLALLASAPIAAALPGPGYPHYYLYWLPPLVLCGVCGLFELAASLARGTARLAYAVGGILIVGLVLDQIPDYRLSPSEWSVRRHGREYLSARDLAALLRAYLPSRKSFYSWGAEPGLYFFSKRSPPSGVVYVTPLLRGPLAAPLTQRLVADLRREKVALVIVNREHPLPATVADLLDRDYVAAASTPGFDRQKPVTFFTRRGDSIDPRIFAWSFDGSRVGSTTSSNRFQAVRKSRVVVSHPASFQTARAPSAAM